jgi:hypothetical protein
MLIAAVAAADLGLFHTAFNRDVNMGAGLKCGQLFDRIGFVQGMAHDMPEFKNSFDIGRGNAAVAFDSDGFQIF